MALIKFNDGNIRRGLNPIDDIFESFFNDSYISDRMISRVPAVNICETDGEYCFELAAPGLKKEDFKINIDRNMLNISVEKRSEDNEDKKKYTKREYNYTSFVNSFALPDSADDASIEAEYTDGVLKISVLKNGGAKMTTRKISIK